jgi:hypothetical protein
MQNESVWLTQAEMAELFQKERTVITKHINGDYFNELLQRIRDIRSSEKVFYRKVLEIYATSIDYDSTAKATQTSSTRVFFQL